MFQHNIGINIRILPSLAREPDGNVNPKKKKILRGISLSDSLEALVSRKAYLHTIYYSSDIYTTKETHKAVIIKY